MNAINYRAVDADRKGEGYSGKVFTSDSSVKVVEMTIEPGGEVRPHATPVHVIFHVIEGEATISVGDESLAVSPGYIVDSPAEVPHGIVNSGEKNFVMLVIQLFCKCGS
jgi:quercetin dioxygenase-like cupin family protein